VCLQLRDIDPKNSDYWLNVGVLHARLGRFEAALSELDKAVELAPGNPRCREVREAVRRARRAS
jgi:Flp pilus assembly protein TadD